MFPVVREVRHLAHRLIQEQGIPSVVRWLRSTERAGWLTRDHRIDIMFDPVGETVSVNEINGV